MCVCEREREVGASPAQPLLDKSGLRKPQECLQDHRGMSSTPAEKSTTARHRQTGRQTDRQTERVRERKSEREKERERKRCGRGRKDKRKLNKNKAASLLAHLCVQAFECVCVSACI